MIRRELRLRGARAGAQVVGQLGAQRALEQRFLESTRGGFDFGGGQRTVSDDLTDRQIQIQITRSLDHQITRSLISKP